MATPQSVLDALGKSGVHKTPVTERATPEGTDPVGIDQITLTVFPDDPEGPTG
ncbi:hypothetical protein [Streptomyces filamentosus]|uniref:hypothetical protein n=1 Tax=Streptomyces filamentosus TaxID=67294 RepID=UPI00332A0F45